LSNACKKAVFVGYFTNKIRERTARRKTNIRKALKGWERERGQHEEGEKFFRTTRKGLARLPGENLILKKRD